jgi:hypothetical protein
LFKSYGNNSYNNLIMKTKITLILALLALARNGGADPLDVWTPFPTGIQPEMYGMTYVGGQFVAFGVDKVCSSIDGINWVEHTPNLDEQLGAAIGMDSVAYGNGRFVAGVTIILTGPGTITSTDGVNWVWDTNESVGGQTIFANGAFISGGFLGIAYGNGLFVADERDHIDTSPDGTNWTYHSVGTTNFDSVQDSLAYGNGQFVRVEITAAQPDWESVVASSSDGTNWVTRLSLPDEALTAVTFANGQFVVVGASDDDSTGPFYTSPDGINWTPREVKYSFSALAWPIGIAYGQGRFVVMDGSGTAFVSGAPFAMLELKPGTNSDSLLLSVRAPVGTACTIQRSRDLTRWQDVTNIVSSDPTDALAEVSPASGPALFYRAVVR